MIALDSQILTQGLCRMLEDTFSIVTCRDGYEALKLMQSCSPDVAVVDLMLEGLDGVSVMQHAKALSIQTRVVVAGIYFSPYVLQTLENLGVQFLVRLGADCHHALAARILDLAQWENSASQQKRVIAEILTALGVKRTGSSHIYLETAIECYMQQPGAPIVGWLYPTVGRLCDSTASAAEKAIRYCIESAWENRNQRIWRFYFPTGKNNKDTKPSNSKFIARIAECVWNQTVPAENKDIREIV